MGKRKLRLLGLAVALVLMITSLPAGCYVSTAIRAHREISNAPPPPPANAPRTLRNSMRASAKTDAESTYSWALKAAIGLCIVHLVISTWGFMKPQSDILGLRGTVIGVLAWSAFVVGIVLGAWI